MLEYSMDEIRVYFEAIQMSKMRELKTQSIAEFNATRGTPKGFQEYLNRLDDVLDSSDPEAKHRRGARELADTLTKISKLGRK